MPSSGYASITFVANEQPTTAKWNLIGSNDASFNTGAGFNDNIILTRHLAAGAVNGASLLNGKIYRRQGTSATIWGGLSGAGTTNYDTTATDPLIQIGDIVVAAGQTNITYPVAFTNPPIILASVTSSAGAYPSWYIVLEANTGFSIQLTGGTAGSLNAHWLAIGI